MSEIFRKILPEEYLKTGVIDRLAVAYLEVFRGFPWFEDSLTVGEVMRRLESQFGKPGLRMFLLENKESEIVAAGWFDTPTLEDIEVERGAQLRSFAEGIMSLNKVAALIWEREVLVKPIYQGFGLGTKIRTGMINFIDKKFPSAIILSRMRDDNFPIIRIAEKLNFKRTGITKPSSQRPEVNHEYWFRAGKGVEK